MPKLQPTGPPLIRWRRNTGDPSNPTEFVTVTLPHAVIDAGTYGEFLDLTRANKRASGTLRIVGTGNRRRFTLAYKDFETIYTQALLKQLITALEQRIVFFTPRTLDAADPSDPSGPVAGEVEEIACRVLSDIPVTRHLTLGYDIEIELEALAPI